MMPGKASCNANNRLRVSSSDLTAASVNTRSQLATTSSGFGESTTPCAAQRAMRSA
jgi:hypothetical protein